MFRRDLKSAIRCNITRPALLELNLKATDQRVDRRVEEEERGGFARQAAARPGETGHRPDARRGGRSSAFILIDPSMTRNTIFASVGFGVFLCLTANLFFAYGQKLVARASESRVAVSNAEPPPNSASNEIVKPQQ